MGSLLDGVRVFDMHPVAVISVLFGVVCGLVFLVLTYGAALWTPKKTGEQLWRETQERTQGGVRPRYYRGKEY